MHGHAENNLMSGLEQILRSAVCSILGICVGGFQYGADRKIRIYPGKQQTKFLYTSAYRRESQRYLTCEYVRFCAGQALLKMISEDCAIKAVCWHHAGKRNVAH